jgi:hypothetical protein
MAVRNTKTGGARKRVAGELKKGATRLKKKPPTVVTASRPNMNEQYKEPKVNAPKTPVAKPAVKKPVLTKKNPGNMNNQQISRKANYDKGTGSK